MEVLKKIGLTLLDILYIYLTLVLSDPINFKEKCEKCLPGYVDSNNCIETGRPTLCSLCMNGKYSSKLDYSTQCLDCTTLFGCSPSLTLLRECTPEHDSLCGCKEHEILDSSGICRINRKDFYLNNGMWCRQCQAGFCKEKDCTEDGTNSSCRPCDVSPNPTFQLETSGSITNMTTPTTKIYDSSNCTKNQPESGGGNTTVVMATVVAVLFIAIIIVFIVFLNKIRPTRQSYDFATIPQPD